LLLVACVTLFMALSLVGCGGGGGTKTPDSLETIAKNKEVHVLTEGVNAPFEFGKDTGFQGMGADVGEAIAKTLGRPLKWVKSKGVAHLFDVLKEGTTVDMIISSVANDPQRAAEFDFSEPYYETGDVIAHHRTEFGITDLASLSGKKVGVVEGRPADAFITSQTAAAGVILSKYSTIDEALGYLNRQEIDAVVGDEILLNYSSVENYPNTNILNTIINKYSYTVAVRKGDANLLAKINETIASLKSSGELAQLETKWVGDVKERAKARASEDREQEELKKAPKTISVSINKQSGNWSMDRLDGFVFVLNGANGAYRSTPIYTDGNHGTCKFNTPVPPGDYSLNISILGLTTKVTVPTLSKSALSMSVNIANGVSISVR
jgi:polar amino acid transport system substrate-binding protein